MSSFQVLVLTVGTGNREQLENTLFTPLRKSIQKGNWSLVVLLPSQETALLAKQLVSQIAEVTFSVRELPKPGDENDPDACFAHFDRVFRELRTCGATITADFTRGTKAMSAALVLAAFRREIPHLRYVTGPRDTRGVVIAGEEEIRSLGISAASARKRLDEVRMFFRQGNFFRSSSPRD